MKTITHNIEIEVFKAVVNVLIDKTVWKALKSVDCVEDDKEYYDGANAMHINTKSGYSILAFKSKEITHGIIAHECMHAVFSIMDRKGISYCIQSEEAFTYVLGYLVDKVTGVFRDNGIEIS